MQGWEGIGKESDHVEETVAANWPDVADNVARIRRICQGYESPLAFFAEWKRASEMNWIAASTTNVENVPGCRLHHGGNPGRRSRVRSREM
mmetsp:Transcript_3442/g.21564  ORF Transcript_3442/g.21564 Transcript_3442/m.21564 type:complete len:91 (-) Transcript_3442:1131-1403(-)